MINILISCAVGAALAGVATFGGVAVLSSSPDPTQGQNTLVTYGDE